jgi:hyperosmotically inducible periplasmic protein
MRLLLGAIVVLTLVSGPALVASADSLGTKLDDTTITTKVKAKLTTDSVKTLVKVHVDTQNGVVHLQGTVPSEADKAEAERLARSTDGVKDVMNDLTIGGTTSSPSASPASK